MDRKVGCMSPSGSHVSSPSGLFTQVGLSSPISNMLVKSDLRLISFGSRILDDRRSTPGGWGALQRANVELKVVCTIQEIIAVGGITPYVAVASRLLQRLLN